jgi:hypothetical protein
MIDRFNHSGRGLHTESDRAMKRKSTVLVPSTQLALAFSYPRESFLTTKEQLHLSYSRESFLTTKEQLHPVMVIAHHQYFPEKGPMQVQNSANLSALLPSVSNLQCPSRFELGGMVRLNKAHRETGLLRYENGRRRGSWFHRRHMYKP